MNCIYDMELQARFFLEGSDAQMYSALYQAMYRKVALTAK